MLPKGRVKVCGAVVLAALASIWAPGCATRGQSVADAGSVSTAAEGGASSAAAAPAVITGASLLTEGESPRLLLTAERPLSTSLFSGEDGRKVVVDVSNAVVSPGMEPPRADGTLVSSLGMKAFTELGVPHVQFEMRAARPVESKMSSDPGSGALSIVLARTPASAPAATSDSAVAVASAPAAAPAPDPEPVPAAPAAEPDAAPAVTAAADVAAPATDAPIVLARHAATGRPASRLASVSARAPKDGGVVIELAGDGDFGYEAFRLADPPRFVLDLAGVRNASHRKQQDVGSGAVSRVRISQFRTEPEPVTRVVVDLASDEMPAVEATKKGLELRFGVRPAEKAKAAAPAVLTADADAGRAPAPGADAVPAAASYEKHETDDPAERVVKPEPKPEPVTTVAAASREFAEPAPAVEAKAAPAEKPAPAAPVAETKPQDAPVAVAASAKQARPQPVAEAAVVRSAPSVVVPPSPAPKAAKKPSAEDKALLEAAETLLEQQQDVVTRPAAGGVYESRTVGAGEKVYTGEPITLNLKDADIKDTLQKFSELTGLNIVIDPGVAGTVTVSLTDIPWDQALELILKINGLGYVLEGNVMRISSIGRLTAEENSRQQLVKAQDQNRPVRTVIQKLSYASTTEAAEIAKKVMTPRGDIIIDERNQSLIIRELPDNIPTVLDLIRNIDQPTPQVMIEARIVEATRTFSRNLGVDWNFHGVADQAHGNTTGLIFPNNVDVTGGLNGTLTNGNQLLKLALGNVLNTFNLDAAITAAEAHGLVKVISSPKVQTQNNQAASIQSGFQIPVQTTVNNTTSVLYVDATLRLTVTPQITAEGTVIMQINLQNREPAPGVAISGGTNVPLLTRDARTKLLVKDGGTAVIGGIFKVTANESQNMVPGLWKIPLLGNLFKNKTNIENTDELMIFITPRIMK